MKIQYSDERNVQILIAVLKANNIRKVIASPGATNVSFVASVNNDPYFEVYSAVDERGAAYIACGLSAESGEAVVLSCTGATASRNYYPALTEAYHKKLPILAVTSSQDFANSTHLSPQYIDRTEHPTDSLKLSVQIPIISDDVQEWEATIKINKAVLELFHRGLGPVHINLASSYCNTFNTTEISNVRIIRRVTEFTQMPSIKTGKRIAITVGAHAQWSTELTEAVDRFCKNYGSVVFVDHSSGYWGKYRILPTILATQEFSNSNLFNVDLLIHIGEEHGDYYMNARLCQANEVWRISLDGELRDTFKKLTNVFEMNEVDFFEHYSNLIDAASGENVYYNELKEEIIKTYNMIPELPFSNIWVAKNTTERFPKEAALHIGVSNTMRSWTFFDFPQKTYTMANIGCRGIDGAIPTAIGMALAQPDKMHFAVMGDLTFFYALNALGNRNIRNNFRLLLINNGCGAEFNIYQHRAYKIYDGDSAEINKFVAAGGHFSSKSRDIVKHFSQDLGFFYLRADNKDDFNKNIEEFLCSKCDKPMIFEIFTDIKDEDSALKIMRHLRIDKSTLVKQKVVGVIGEPGVSLIKKIIK